MRSELFRIPVDVAGIPLLGFGLALAVWLVGAGVYALRLRGAARRGEQADWIGFAGLVAAVAAALVVAPRFVPEGIPIRGYGVMLLLALASGVAMALHRARQRGIADDVIYSLVIWLVVCGIAGARLFHVIEYWQVSFAGLPLREAILKALMFTEGGLVVYGSLIGAAAAFVVFVRRHGLPLLGMADLLAPSLAVGLAIGRLGCLLNGCCFGGVCDRPWAITFPDDSQVFVDQLSRGELHGVRLSETEQGLTVSQVWDEQLEITPGAKVAKIDGRKADSLADSFEAMRAAYQGHDPVLLELEGGAEVALPVAEPRVRSLPVHPTQLYSAINAALLGWVLWLAYPLRRRDGEVFGLMLTIYPVSRFLLEMIRVDESNFLGTGLSISQNLSIVILSMMAFYWVWLLRQEGRGVRGELTCDVRLRGPRP
ncbi:Prolipoprotein diacylglyceryl transferase [Pirellulimonas nuda]|uniref:Phosphatidylglycerol--prolipoprotein diacylglyceryl transferase n=1 Tax=Pirellulimonas nuda TaxID=2528009 RepID=A0A518D6L5_9BACT|nr:prolipoprotein diacylglyceryl transferase [Pirellulimonas nuda]QDU87095.1 Prolipoprotein diacylglyceryl transferase [Pirellulimonas nuda]